MDVRTLLLLALTILSPQSYLPIQATRLTHDPHSYIPICASANIAYGWTLSRHTHLAVPITLQFIVGFTVTGIFNVCNTLIVDVNPERPATASASVSITRCLVAAGGVSVIEVLLNAIGPGWTFTIVGVMCWATVPVLLLVTQKGWYWRKQRAEREKAKG